MKRGLQGRQHPFNSKVEGYKSFIPHPLPPNPPLDLRAISAVLEQATLALGKLDGITLLLPDMSLFLYFYVRKEAVLSSQIEGTQSSLSDLLLFEHHEVPGVPINDVQEVSNYVAAMDYGLKRLQGGFPLSLRLIKEIHEKLLAEGRGSDKSPGEFRSSQNWIGGSRPGNARFVPPPPDEVLSCMGALEKFLHNDSEPMPVLIKAALSHVQFETVHPFLDGNGRLGRLLITFLLCSEGALSKPLLYLSLFFKTHREAYYDLLQRVRTEGIWEEWLDFFLTGVKTTANQAAAAAQEILQLFDADRKKIESIGRQSGSVLQVHHLLQKEPVLTVGGAVKRLRFSTPTVGSAFHTLQKLQILKQIEGRKRNVLYTYDAYMKILNKGTEPIKSS